MSNEEFTQREHELNLKGAEILMHMIEAPFFSMSDDFKAAITYEIFRLVAGRSIIEAIQIRYGECSNAEIARFLGVSEKVVEWLKEHK